MLILEYSITSLTTFTWQILYSDLIEKGAPIVDESQVISHLHQAVDLITKSTPLEVQLTV